MIRLPGRCFFVQIFFLFFASLGIAAEEVWIEVKSPHFIVISNAPAKQARRTAKLFEQYRLLIQTAMVDCKVDPPIPLTVFAAKNEKSFKTLLAEEKQEKGAAKRTGWFLPGPEHQLVALRIDAPEDETLHVIFHEYVHLVTNLTYGELPLWLQEGLAEFFAYSELSQNLSYLGKVKYGVIDYLRSHPRIPLQTLLSVKHDSPYYREQEKATAFYHNSWALVHYLIVGDRNKSQNKLMSYIGMILNGVPEMEAANRAFGDLKLLEKDLGQYIYLPTTAYFEVPATLLVDEARYEVRPLPLAESLALRGELLLFYKKTDRARGMLEEALQADPRNARANEAMGQLFMRLDDRAQAGKYFLAAADLDSKSCTANYFAAHAIILQNGDSDTAEKYLRRAIELNAEFAPAYGQLSVLLRRKGSYPEALACARKLESLQPGILVHKINVANIMADMGRIDEAYEYGRRVSAIARDENDRKLAASFMTWIANVRDQRLRMERMQEAESERTRMREQRRPELSVNTRYPGPESGEEDKQENDRPAVKRREEIAKLASAERGPAVRMEGIIQSVTCEAPEILEVTLDGNGVSKKLYSDRHSAIRIHSAAAARKKDFQVCRDLEGRRAEIEYQLVTSKYFSGYIKSITLQK
ncbi:MAG: DUF1570 domain-containing protein [Acidobacteria bacterium]|nr:DUF1570 domain-containing protein [Acidobacteriota bacterium]